jgi:hypothetical protein
VSATKPKADLAASGVPDIRDLLRRAESGDESAMPALRKVFEGSAGIVDAVGNMATQLERTLIGNAAGKSLAFKEATGYKMTQLRTELAGANPTPLEHLLAERIALCWLSLHEAEVRFAQSKDLTFKQAEYWQKRIDSAHKRYMSAIKTLATVRKLAVPALQVNIAKRQVNVLNATDNMGAAKTRVDG